MGESDLDTGKGKGIGDRKECERDEQTRREIAREGRCCYRSMPKSENCTDSRLFHKGLYTLVNT